MHETKYNQNKSHMANHAIMHKLLLMYVPVMQTEVWKESYSIRTLCNEMMQSEMKNRYSL